jgi:hypothetical protein
MVTTASTKRIGPRQKAVIGWREWVVLPQFGIDAIKAKIDTGAQTSSLHASSLKRFTRHGAPMVRFKVMTRPHKWRKLVQVETPVVEERWVKSSNGERQLRPVVRTVICIMNFCWPVELTLTSRESMSYRMLIGREALRGHALVDPGRSYLGGIPVHLLEILHKEHQL